MRSVRMVWATICAIFLVFGAGQATIAQISEGDQKYILSAYQMCIQGEFRNLLKYDLASKDIYPLMRIADEDVFKYLKSKCSSVLTGLLSRADDAATAGQYVDEMEVADQRRLLTTLQSLRPKITTVVNSIRMPGPRPAVRLPEFGVAMDDYPSMALRNNEQGTSEAVFTVSADGKIAACSASGATELLNANTCRVIQRRWKYAPARDAHNEPVASVLTKYMTYSMGSVQY